MKLQDALKKIFWQFGVVVLQEKRLMAILADFKAFDEYPSLKQVFKGISDGGYAKEICSLIISGDTKKLQSYAGDVKNSLVSDQNFRKELADYSVDSILYALGSLSSVSEPSYHGFDPFKEDKQAELSRMTPSELSGLGEKYYYGRGVKQDYKEAAKYFQRAGEQGDSNAQFRLSYMYEHGMGVEKNYTRALYWFRMFSAQGPKLEQNRIKERKLKVLSLVSLGDPRGQCELGDIYSDQLNYPEAFKWYSKAAAQGYADAQYKLGRMFECGHGGTPDKVEAKEWYTKAAKQGHADAQYSLGHMYDVWLDYVKARNWYKKAAGKGNAAAQCSLGQMYEYGNGVKINYTKAIEWYEKAADQGYAVAQYRLCQMYEDGKGVESDDISAMELYRKAAEQGNADAQYSLGHMYEWMMYEHEDEDERGIDRQIAIDFYQNAAQQGHVDAEDRLIYLLGLS